MASAWKVDKDSTAALAAFARKRRKDRSLAVFAYVTSLWHRLHDDRSWASKRRTCAHRPSEARQHEPRVRWITRLCRGFMRLQLNLSMSVICTARTAHVVWADQIREKHLPKISFCRNEGFRQCRL